MFMLGAECVKVGLRAQLEMRGDSVVHYARNMMVARFLESDCTHLFFWDNDNPPDSLMQVFRLLLADKDIIAAVPPIKKFNWPAAGIPAGVTFEQWQMQSSTYSFFPLAGQSADDDGFAEVLCAGTGFMCIKRGVFDSLMKAYPRFAFTPNEPAAPGSERFYWRFFQYLVDPETNRELPEDFSFCRLWRDIGGRIYVDTESKLSHYGEHVFRGDLTAHLEYQQARRDAAA